MKISLNEDFKIQKNFTLCGEDLYSLNNLYLPLIGVDSYALYNFLFTLSSNESYTFKKIMDALHLVNVAHLDNALGKLEGMSLIRRYYSAQKGFLFFLKQPLNVASFLANPVLFNFLSSQIGEVEMKNIKSFATKQVKGYDDVSKPFNEVYKISTTKSSNLFMTLLGNKIKDNIVIKNPEFDYTFFKLTFDSNMIDEKVLDDESFSKSIINISYTYGLNEEEMKQAVLNTIAVDGDLKIADISKNARLIYQEKNKGTTFVFETKEPDPFILSNDDEETVKLIHLVDSLSPSQLLESLNGGIKPSVVELKIFEDLLNNTKFPIGVINVMILLVNEEKKGKLPSYNYFEKIANEWARNNIKTTKDAIDYIKKQKEEREAPKEAKKYREKKVKPKPTWQGDYEENSKPKEINEELTEEEKENILKKAKKALK